MRLRCRYERFQANPTILEVTFFYEAHSQQRCSERRGWLRGSCLRLSQRFSFSRCWSSSLLARCSLPPPRPSQQPQLLPIWRPSETQTRLKMAPTSRGGSDPFTGDVSPLWPTPTIRRATQIEAHVFLLSELCCNLRHMLHSSA